MRFSYFGKSIQIYRTDTNTVGPPTRSTLAATVPEHNMFKPYTPDISASLLLLSLSSHTPFPFHTSLLPCPRDLLSSLRAALVVPSSALSRCFTRDVDCTIAFRLPVRTSAKFVLSPVSAPFVCLVACFAPSCSHFSGRVCVVLLLQVQQQTRAPDSVFEVRTLPVPGSSLSRIALFSDWNLSSIQQLFRPDCASLCKRLDFEPRVLPSSSSARSSAPSTRPFFWCSTWARRAGGAGGASASRPCPESQATRPQPGALDLPPHVSTPSYFA